MPRPNANQARFNAYLSGTNKGGLRRAQQIVKARAFTYDGALRPTCLKCGAPREQKRGLHCEACS